ncbi:hypothetical protein D4764_11G0003420, partial [Takifugu flavidus]
MADLMQQVTFLADPAPQPASPTASAIVTSPWIPSTHIYDLDKCLGFLLQCRLVFLIRRYFKPWGREKLQSCHWLELRAAKGLPIRYLAYLKLKVELCGINIIRRCYEVLFSQHGLALFDLPVVSEAPISVEFRPPTHPPHWGDPGSLMGTSGAVPRGEVLSQLRAIPPVCPHSHQREERRRRHQSHLCLYCSGQGHFVVTCPVKSPALPVTGGIL